MKNKKTLAVILAVIIITFLGIASFQQAQQRPQPQQQQDDPPTPIQLGVMSEKQRKNSRLYNRSPEIPSLLLGDKNVLRGIGESMISEDSPQNLLSQAIYFQKIACRSDVTVIGRVKNKISQLSEDTKSIFTDYDFEVLDIIKSNHNLNILPGNIITVTRSGGVVRFNNRRIEVVNQSYRRIRTGKVYLLFLNYITDSNSFAPSSLEGSLEIQGNKINRLRSKMPPYLNGTDDLASVLANLRISAQRCS